MHSEELIEKFNDLFPNYTIEGHDRIDAHSIILEIREFGGLEIIFTWYNDRSFKLETK